MEIAVHDYYRCVDWDGENFGDCGGGYGVVVVITVVTN